MTTTAKATYVATPEAGAFASMNNSATARKLSETWTSTEVVAAMIEELVTAIRLEAERRDLGTGTIVISVQRLRHVMREFLLG
jgi:hypothetical protein